MRLECRLPFSQTTSSVFPSTISKVYRHPLCSMKVVGITPATTITADCKTRKSFRHCTCTRRSWYASLQTVLAHISEPWKGLTEPHNKQHLLDKAHYRASRILTDYRIRRSRGLRIDPWFDPHSALSFLSRCHNALCGNLGIFSTVYLIKSV